MSDTLMICDFVASMRHYGPLVGPGAGVLGSTGGHFDLQRKRTVDMQVQPYLCFDGRCDEATTKTFFSPKFGMLADKFGVHGMIMVRHGDRKIPQATAMRG